MKEYICDDVDLLAYLNGSLDAKERAALDIHLQSCSDCQTDLKQLSEAQDILPLALQQVSPPDLLKSQVLAKAFAARPPLPAKDSLKSSRRRPTIFVQLWRRWLPWSVSTALLLVSLVLTQQVVGTRHEVNQLKQQLADSAKAVALQPTNYLATAQGHAIVIPAHSGVQLIVYVSNVRPTVGSEVYHVWLWNHGTRESAGTMTVDAKGTGVLHVTLNGQRAVFNGIGITLEPDATTKVPTGPKILGAAKL